MYTQPVPADLDKTYAPGKFSPTDKMRLIIRDVQAFFTHVDIDPKNINLLDGIASDLVAECKAYAPKIEQAGGIELHLGGIGITSIFAQQTYTTVTVRWEHRH